MKVKTADLIGPALDWAVAKCEVYPMGIWYDEDEMPMICDYEVPEWEPSTEWSQGGPIIEREGIELFRNKERDRWYGTQYGWPKSYGPTPLIAAMRCYVASKLGDTIEVPEELQ